MGESMQVSEVDGTIPPRLLRHPLYAPKGHVYFHPGANNMIVLLTGADLQTRCYDSGKLVSVEVFAHLGWDGWLLQMGDP